MTTIQRSLIVDRDIRDVFEIMYTKNETIFKNIFNILEWEKNEWKMQRNKKKRKEIIYLYIPDLPDELVSYLVENDKYLKLEIKSKILVDTPNYQKIKTKFRMLNVNPVLRTILENLELVKMKNVIELRSDSNQKTSINIKAVAKLYVPNTKSISNFMINISEKMIVSLLDSLK